MNIALDLDGTLVNTDVVVRDIMRAYLGRPDFIATTYNPMDQADLAFEERKFMLSLYLDPNVVSKARPIIPDHILNYLYESHQVYIVTSRPLSNYVATVKQCVKYFNKVPVVAMDVEKTHYYSEFEIDTVVEDSPEHVLEAVRHCARMKKGFLFKRSYNIKEDFNGYKTIDHVNSWDEVISGIEELARRR